MSDLRSKCIGAAASVLVTGAILLSLVMLAQAYGVYSWMDAAERVAAASAPSHAVAATVSTPAKIPTRF